MIQLRTRAAMAAGVILAGLITVAGMVSCGSTSTKGLRQEVRAVKVIYNPLVESFTAGTISRLGSVEVALTDAVAADAKLDKYIELSPKVKGSWGVSAEDPRKLVFRPESEFERGMMYTVNMELKKLLPDNPEARDFSFSFRVLPAAAAAEMTTFTCEQDGTYTVEGALFTADFEDSTQVLRMAEWDGDDGGAVHWMHSADGRRHGFVVSGIVAKGKARELILTVKDEKAGYDKEEVLTVQIPDKKSFAVHSVGYFADRERYIEVRFTRILNPDQDIEGLVQLEEVGSVRRVEANKVLIYPEKMDDETSELMLCVDAALRTNEGVRLGRGFQQEVKPEGGNPAVRFVGSGTIVPPSSALVGGNESGKGIPFQAMGLRAVRVEVFRILETSMGQFLQGNELSDQEGGSIMRTARPVASKTIFLDRNGEQKLQKWGTYSLDLDELVKPERGALYRISISFDRSMAVLPCIPAEEQITAAQAQTADETRLKNMVKQFDKGGYYWDGDDYNWHDYSWRERNDPCTSSYYYNKSAQRNLLVTDLGVIAKASDRPEMLFIVHSITTTRPVKDAHVELRNFQGQKVGWGVTDGDGQVLVAYENGRPYYAVVSKDDERTYLKVNAGSELSTSTFDVSGEQVQDGLRGFVWTERGVWRPGDTIYMNFVTAGNTLPKGHPVTVELRSPLGQLYQKRVATHAVGGIYGFVLNTDPSAPTGVWNATVSVGGATFVKRLRIEAVKPNRLKIDLRFPGKVIQRGRPLDATLHSEWLTGARAGNLKYTIETEFTAIKNAFEGYTGYVFDNAYQAFRPENAPEITGTTDAKGNARITATFEGGEKAGGMLQANITTRLFEPSGEASVDGMTMLYSPFASYTGIRVPEGAEGQLNTGQAYKFGIVMVTPQGKAMGNRKVEVCAYKVDWHWWWSSEREELARYVSDRSLRPMKRSSLTTGSNGKVDYEFKVPKEEWGTYYITARDLESGHESAVLVYMDWPDYGNRHNEGGAGAMRLSVSMDKKSYEVGDKATVSFPAMKGSRAIISVENGSRVLKVMPVECSEGQMKHKFEVTPDMQPNAYVNVTLLQPYGSVENDLPVRIYGIVPLTAVSSASKLEPVVQCPDEVLPEAEMTVTVSEKQGQGCAYTLTLVDEGLLDLTRFRTPDPWGAFNARVALGVTTWDIYNNVLGAYGGKIEQMFAIGGDDALMRAGKASVNRFPPVVKYLGTFELGSGKTVTHKIKLPAYMGRVRVMVVAVSQSADGGNGAWGSAERSVAVRAPLMVLGSAPRAVAPGDEIVVPATLIATQDGVGSVTVSLQANDVFTVAGAATQTVALPKTGDKMAYFRLKVKDAVPSAAAGGRIELRATGGGKSSHYAMDIPVRVLSLPVTQGQGYTVAAGKSWNGTVPLQGMPGTQKLMLEVSSVQPINAAQRMEYLSTYPYGCIEQITSAVFPLLYLPDMADLSANEKATAQGKVNLVLNKYKSYATPEGSMGYWPGDASPNVWGSAYALHFMTAAGHKGYQLPAGVYDRLKAAVKSMAVRWSASDYAHLNLVQAYQLYALALAGEPEIGAMNRLRQSGKLTDEARWMLGAAYAVAGRTDVGRTVVAGSADTTLISGEGALSQRVMTYGSEQRAQAVELLSASLLGMTGEAAQLSQAVSRTLSGNEWLSTQTTAWSMVAMGEYVARNGKVSALEFDWSAGGRSGQVSSDSKKMMWSGAWNDPASGKVSVTNKTKGTLYIRTVGSGISSGQGVAVAANGISVAVRYLNGNGQPIDAAVMTQGVDFVSEVTVRNQTAEPLFNLMLTEPVASGWEIRPDAALQSPGVSYRDVRDDRVDSYIPELGPNGVVTVRTRLNATYAGVYTLPAVRCSAMYDGSVAGNTASGTARIGN